jgi:hypothetical protein
MAGTSPAMTMLIGQSRSKSLIETLARVFSSTVLTMTAQ